MATSKAVVLFLVFACTSASIYAPTASIYATTTSISATRNVQSANSTISLVGRDAGSKFEQICNGVHGARVAKPQNDVAELRV